MEVLAEESHGGPPGLRPGRPSGGRGWL